MRNLDLSNIGRFRAKHGHHEPHYQLQTVSDDLPITSGINNRNH